VRWLDVATGTGGVAVRAARRGAEVTGLDFTPELLTQAGEAAAAEGVELELVEGDAQRLPFEDGAFDVVSSCFGVIFAPDTRAAAAELARVCRPGRRLGLTAWQPEAGLHARFSKIVGGGGPRPPEAWADELKLRGLLSEDFELTIEERTWSMAYESLEELWEFTTTAVPPIAALLRTLDEQRQGDLRRHFEELYADSVEPDGRVVDRRGYLLVLGRRR
jgi:ubiquinone/menaquinone biosynthesis C-methylase UbiE